MSINISVYSNANSSSRSISFDFTSGVLASSDQATSSADNSFYFKITTSAKQDNGSSYPPVKIVRSLSELALNKQKQRVHDFSNAYGSIKEMIVDYTYDYINGHSANLYGSECTEQKPMKF